MVPKLQLSLGQYKNGVEQQVLDFKGTLHAVFVVQAMFPAQHPTGQNAIGVNQLTHLVLLPPLLAPSSLF